MKIVKLDRRHNLFHKGYSHAFVVNRWTADTNRLERAVKELEGYRWDSTFWGKAPKYGTRPFYIGVKNESTLTLALLKL